MKSSIKIRDEEKLLLALCRLGFSDAELKELKSLADDIKDWDYLSKLANAHGVAALAGYNLEKYDLCGRIPENVSAYFRNTRLISLGRNTFNTETIGEVLNLLNKDKIKTIILKGLALENSVYGNSGLRQMSDVDILIDRNEGLRAREILLNNGYVSIPVKSLFHKFILSYAGKHLPSLLKKGASVEIHHELFGGKGKILTRKLYETSYEVEVRGEKAWFPEPQLFFLYLIKHLWMHEMTNESQLRLYTDLVVLIDKYDRKILNDELIRYASEAGLEEILGTHLGSLRDFWGIPFDKNLNDLIDLYYRQDSVNKFVFFLGSPKDNPHVEKAKFYRQLIGDIPGLHRKIIFFLGDIFPSLSFMKKRYGCNKTWKVLLYYPHRLGKILWLFRK
jgi:hypothetical protein